MVAIIINIVILFLIGIVLFSTTTKFSGIRKTPRQQFYYVINWISFSLVLFTLIMRILKLK